MTIAQKNPLVDTLNRWASERLKSFQNLLGKALPATLVSLDATHTIVTVQFPIKTAWNIPQITCPLGGTPEYDRYPLQPGAPGVFLSSDVYLGGVSGLGGGVATMAWQANMANGVWFPIGSTGCDTLQQLGEDNPNQRILYGPDGAVLRDRGTNGQGPGGSSVRVEIDSKGNVQIWGAKSVSTDVAGYGSRTTWMGGSNWQVDNYVTGATVTTVNHPINPPMIPAPT